MGLLGFFKYADFAITQLNLLGTQYDLFAEIPHLNLILPIAISFYTFHSVGYIIDVYRDRIKPTKSFRQYAIFIAFFPQLVAGPILRASHFLPQLREKIQNNNLDTRLRQIVIENTNLKLGITLMALGFLKKMFFADNISKLADVIFVNPQGLESFSIILGAIAFGIQIYCDFSGYSDIAIGAALILGFKIPINFNKPYFATSPSEFWHRWHISLSTWLRDYLYVPLGGNRTSRLRTYCNLLIVMFLGGLWHGASWNFVIWGMLHGAYLAVHKLITDKLRISKSSFFRTKIFTIISILITQYLVFLAWISFRVHDFNDMKYSMIKYIFLDFKYAETLGFIKSNQIECGLILTFFVLHFISYKLDNLSEKISTLTLWQWSIFLSIIITLILLFFGGNTDDFIYFKF